MAHNGSRLYAFAGPTNPDPIQLHQDLYCLSCGYNLRGLTGDLIRCPECGADNALAQLVRPAHEIKSAIRRMETAPTMCVACAVSFPVSLCLVAFTGGWFFFLPVGCLALWASAVARTRKAFEASPGWREVLLQFHVTFVLWIVWFPLFLLFAFIEGQTSIRLPRGTGWLILIVSCILFGTGVRMYRTTRRGLRTMQREAAVRIARASPGRVE